MVKEKNLYVAILPFDFNQLNCPFLLCSRIWSSFQRSSTLKNMNLFCFLNTCDRNCWLTNLLFKESQNPSDKSQLTKSECLNLPPTFSDDNFYYKSSTSEENSSQDNFKYQTKFGHLTINLQYFVCIIFREVALQTVKQM